MSEEAKKPEPAAESGSAPDKTGKLGMILSLVNLIFIIGIGAVVFIQFQKDKKRESVADIQVSEEAHGGGEHGGGEHGGGHEEKAEGGHGGGEHGGGEHGAPAAKKGDQVVTLDQFTVNLSTSVGTPPRFARVVIALEVPNSDTAQEVTQKMAPVRNAIIDLFNIFSLCNW
jgi:flagellar basal body-associated protein FliL